MTKDKMRLAALTTIDRLFERADIQTEIARLIDYERECVERMLEAENDGKRTILSTGVLAHTERIYPAISGSTLWALIVRGSDLLAGSMRAGFGVRHPELRDKLGAAALEPEKTL